MSILLSILIGFVVGLIARALMPGKDSMGFIITTLLGIGGALLGKFLGQAMGLYNEGDPVGFFMSLLGALLLLFIYNAISRRKEAP
ncbi:MAG: GlsB/YeaQ/YmgE family stress response membrane protein [Parachlamydiaceae bacterium]|nr:GlsB/YeaQ/YmgE family stress response membrane protein [Parachlamydiaceae bacterium]